MINDISQNAVGMMNPQSKGDVDSVSRIQSKPVDEVSAAAKSSKKEDVQETGSILFDSTDEAAIEEVVDDLNEFAQAVNRQLEFFVDKESGKTIIKVIDSDTGETIRDIPPEEILNMQKHLKEASEKLFHSAETGTSLLFQGKA